MKFIKNTVINLALLLVSLAIGLWLGEWIAAKMEPKVYKANIIWTGNDTLGFVNKPNQKDYIHTDEFNTYMTINALGMSDDEVAGTENAKTKILVVGDSHTFAAGAASANTWANVLERMLFKPNDTIHSGTVYNTGTAGYNLGQYLLTYRKFRKILKPKYLIVGFSSATDVYDLIPPRKGGFVYGGNYPNRTYFDLDSNNNLVELQNVVKQDTSSKVSPSPVSKAWFSFQAEDYALYRLLKRSKLAAWVAANIEINGKKPWTGMQTVLKIKPDEEEQYRWTLATKLLEKMAEETQKDSVKMILVNIPYVPQVYDEIWDSSFGRQPDVYSRTICAERLAAIAKESNIGFVNTMPILIEWSKKYNRRMHYLYDGHPTEEGHRAIATAVYAYFQQELK
jgi:lysophospholipase L1-like esterase